jgi:hypothetical protein
MKLEISGMQNSMACGFISITGGRELLQKSANSSIFKLKWSVCRGQ